MMHPQQHIRIREAVTTDIPMIVDVHVTSWNATYPDYYPKPTPSLRLSQWEKLFGERSEWFCFVAVNEKSEIIGFATGDRFDDPLLPYQGELCKIHMYKEYQRRGIGTRLVGCVARRLLQKGIASMILFADPQNPNIAFYDKLGGTRILDEHGNFSGAFGWMDISALNED